jgi:hypothetical protein
MKEISSKTGSDYDRTAVQRLREAHGIVLPILSGGRISTRNDLVRAFADDGALYVNRHIGYLESTGWSNYAALPEPQSPGLLSGAASWPTCSCRARPHRLPAGRHPDRAPTCGAGGPAGKATLPPMVTTSPPGSRPRRR